MGKKDLDGAAKNWAVVVEQFEDYTVELDLTVFPDIKEAWDDKDIPEVLHKCHAINEEFFDKNPRINSYLSYIVVPLAGVGAYTVFGWVKPYVVALLAG